MRQTKVAEPRVQVKGHPLHLQIVAVVVVIVLVAAAAAAVETASSDIIVGFEIVCRCGAPLWQSGRGRWRRRRHWWCLLRRHIHTTDNPVGRLPDLGVLLRAALTDSYGPQITLPKEPIAYCSSIYAQWKGKE